jgi:SAM-dependent MidA family methyltransferase
VDVAPADSPHHLRLVLSPSATPAVRALLPRRLGALSPAERASVSAIEIGALAMAAAAELARRVAAHRGVALLIDYGRDAYYEASLRAIKAHEFVSVTEAPGTADLSAHVDFSALRTAATDAAGAAASWHGPVTQSEFLVRCGILERARRLLEATSAAAGGGDATEEAARASVEAALTRLLGGEDAGGMGVAYVAACIAGAADFGSSAPVVFAEHAAEAGAIENAKGGIEKL